MTERFTFSSPDALAARIPDGAHLAIPADRRGVLVRLTPEGKRTVDAAFTELVDAERGFLADLPDDDRGRLADLLRTLLGPFSSRG